MKWFWPVMMALAAASASGRTWTSTAGTQLEADYVGVRDNTVLLRKTDGKQLEVGLQFLSQADRDFVKAQADTAQAGTGAKTEPAPSLPAFKTPAASPSARSDILTDEEIAALKREIPGARSNVKYVFNAGFAQKRLTEVELKRLKAGQIPFRITADLIEMTETNGKVQGKRIPGAARFYVLDGDGKVLVSRRESLDKLCPT